MRVLKEHEVAARWPAAAAAEGDWDYPIPSAGTSETSEYLPALAAKARAPRR